MIKILGIFIGHGNLAEANWLPRLEAVQFKIFSLLAQWVRRLKSRRKGWVYLLTYWLLDPYGVTILLAFSGCVEFDWELLPSFYCDLFKAWTALQSSWSPTAGFQVPCGGWPLSHFECLM